MHRSGRKKAVYLSEKGSNFMLNALGRASAISSSADWGWVNRICLLFPLRVFSKFLSLFMFVLSHSSQRKISTLTVPSGAILSAQ